MATEYRAAFTNPAVQQQVANVITEYGSPTAQKATPDTSNDSAIAHVLGGVSQVCQPQKPAQVVNLLMPGQFMPGIPGANGQASAPQGPSHISHLVVSDSVLAHQLQEEERQAAGAYGGQ